MAKHSNVHEKKTLDRDNSAEQLMKENIDLQKQLQKVNEKICQIRNEEKEKSQKYTEEMNKIIEIEKKFKALEAEYIEEKQISALYHEIFSKQQKQIKSLQKAIKIFNSNTEKEHES